MKNTKLVSLLSLCAANVIGLSIVTFAWFTAKQSADNSLNQIALVKSDIIEKVTFHKYHSLDVVQETGHYTFEIDDSDDEDLGKYSTIGSDFQVLLKVELTEFGKSNDLNIYGLTSALFYHGETTINGEGEETPSHLLAKEGNSLSSIICFYAFSESELSTENGYYELDISSKTKNNFVKEENGKKVLNTDKVFFGEIDKQECFYIVLDYDIELIEEIYSLNLGNSAISGEIDSGDDLSTSYITYVPDFSFYVG